MGKRSKSSITNEESLKKKKIRNYVAVDSISNEVKESTTEKKDTQDRNKLEVTGNKVSKLKKPKIKKLEVESNFDHTKEPAKAKKVKQTDALNKSAVIDEEKVVNEKMSKNKKQKKVASSHDSEEPIKQKKCKKSEAAAKSVNSESEKAKNIILMDGESQHKPATTGTTQKKFLNDDEAEVRDEDIDKFCDEVDEEDNAQFEDWVKLIEAKLHSNKKKPV